MAGIRDWSQLNPDVLRSISETLTNIFDHVRFRSVCSTWRAAAGPIPPHPRHLPYLLLIPRNDNNNSPCHVIAPLDPHRQIYTLQTYPSLRRYCFGSIFGRFLVVNSDCDFVSVFDPLPGGRWTYLRPHIPVDIDEYEYVCRRAKILSVDPYLILIVLIRDDIDMISFVWRQGDDELIQIWTQPEYIDPEDVTLYNGMYYFVDSRDTTYVVSSSTLQLIHKFSCPEMVVYEDWDSRETFLVESSSGDLLMVVWNKDLSVLVFRLGGNKWEKATNIGDDTLFLDECNAMCFPSGRFPGYMKNCVYIVPECDTMPKVSIYDIAKDEVIESLEYLNGHYKAVWVSNAQ